MVDGSLPAGDGSLSAGDGGLPAGDGNLPGREDIAEMGELFFYLPPDGLHDLLYGVFSHVVFSHYSTDWIFFHQVKIMCNKRWN